MTRTSKKIIFFGTEDYSLSTLQALVEASFPIAAVVTKPDAPRGRGQKLAEPPVKTFALAHDIPVWQPARLRDIASDIQSLQPVAGVLVAYGKIIPQSIIDLFTPGIINVHPSLLPRWRGPSPIEAAIYHGDSETGVSIMQLEAGMDSGPVYIQRRLPLDGTETKHELYDQLFSLGNDALVASLPAILSDELQPDPQDESRATYCSLLSKDDALIDPSTMTAAGADAHVRAYLDFPRSKIAYDDQMLIITRAHVASQTAHALSFLCNDGNYLVIDELISPKSGKKMTAEDFLRGHST